MKPFLKIKPFLKNDWQKQPVVFRAAIPFAKDLLSPSELLALAEREQVESRIIQCDKSFQHWDLKYGPFSLNFFNKLPPKHATILVQDVDKFIPKVAELLDSFRFIAGWRVDDIMVSLAKEQGTVGPHVDQYDVFLVQGQGTRRWHFSKHKLSEKESAFIEGIPVKILKNFRKEVTVDLLPGDVLYLPPGVAHFGIAQTKDCITYSVGFRSPNYADLILSYMDEHRKSTGLNKRHKDKNAEISFKGFGFFSNDLTDGVLKGARHLVWDSAHLQRWLMQQLSEPKFDVEPPKKKISTAEIHRYLSTEPYLFRNARSRIFYCMQKKNLFVGYNGKLMTLNKDDQDFVKTITDSIKIDTKELVKIKKEQLKILCDLVNEGVYILTK